MAYSPLPVLLKDFYKVGHKFQYPKGTNKVYSNLTARSSRVPGTLGTIFFGLQYFILEYLIDQFSRDFFQKDRGEVVKAYKRMIDACLGPGTDVSHIGELHEMRYLPLHIKALPEGTFVPLRVPYLTIVNTEDRFFWLTNMLETLMSAVLWKGITSATTAFRYRKVFEGYARITGADPAFVPWQGHDFSFRGMSGVEDACISGAAHLQSFTGTDTIPAIPFLEKYYGANVESELIGGSVPATEHSVMCMGGASGTSLVEGEFETFKRLITEVYPSGIVSIVSDTWDLWTVVTEYLPKLRDVILGRPGKVVIRPDSGDPVKILCGDREAPYGTPQRAGVIKLLFDTFGGSFTTQGYAVLDPHIGAIYGDSITPERQLEILKRLEAMGYASSNVVLGIGSFTYEYVTRDTYGLAMKATYGEVNGKGQAIFKEPKTDDGTKNSARGLLRVDYDKAGKMILIEDVDLERERGGLLQTVFKNGVPYNMQSLSEIRKRVAANL